MGQVKAQRQLNVHVGRVELVPEPPGKVWIARLLPSPAI